MSTITCIELLQDNITIVVSFKVLNITALNTQLICFIILYNLVHPRFKKMKITNYQLQLYSAAVKNIYVIKK